MARTSWPAASTSGSTLLPVDPQREEQYLSVAARLWRLWKPVEDVPDQLAVKMWLLGVTWIQCPWLSMVLRGLPVRTSTFMVRPPNPS